MTRPPFGVILAGGLSRRYGSPKALATLGGVRLVDRVRGALEEAVDDVVLVANEVDDFAGLGLPVRPDVKPGLGALGGILTAVCWAREEVRPGAVVVACDMPFLHSGLLVRLADEALGRPASAPPRELPGEAADPAPDIVAPESGGRRGIEPMCAYYSTRCIAAIDLALARGDRHIVSFFPDVRVQRLPLDVVRTYGDPGLLFMNVNTPAERARAEGLLEAADG